MSVLLVIPARYASTRYPGKALAELRGASGDSRSLIERSWRAAREAKGVDRIVVSTDDDRIRAAAEGFGAEVAITSSECRNGTERCAATLEALETDGGPGFEIVVNLQGDAPLTPPWFVEKLVEGLRARPDVGMATPVLRCDWETLSAFQADRRAGRVGGTTAVFASDGSALYFSKEVLPFCPAGEVPLAGEPVSGGPATAGDGSPVFHHVGIYAYRPEALTAYRAWPPGPLETMEGLEQLRFLERGETVLCVEVEARGREFWELNNPEDIPRLEAMMARMGIE